MKTVVRRGVFETNSSSSHSITISDRPQTATLRAVDGVIEVYPGEFGWEEETYNDPATKASYALTYATYGNPAALIMLKNVIERHTGCEVRFCGIEANEYGGLKDGYIDHQSLGMGVPQKAFASEDDLEAFIFCPESLLVTDNDNH